MKCVSPTETIRLHNKNLKIDTGKTVLKNLNQTQESLTILETAHDLDDLLTLIVSPPLQTDLHYLIDLHFEGDLEEKKVGYYRSFYWSNDGVKKWVGVTYFKPNHARRAFPCFDELTFKAQFSISLGRSADYKSVSNMPLLKTEEM